MVATVGVYEGNGAGTDGFGTWTLITSGRYATVDAYLPGDSNPCVVPTSGNNYSYWKNHRIAWTGIGTKISNIRWYTSGHIATNWTPGASCGLFVAQKANGASVGHGCPTASYQAAGGSVGETGYAIYAATASGGHVYYNPTSSQPTPPVNADTFTSLAPLLVDPREYTTDTHSFHVVSQVMLGTDATQGDKPNETLTFRYDEI